MSRFRIEPSLEDLTGLGPDWLEKTTRASPSLSPYPPIRNISTFSTGTKLPELSADRLVLSDAQREILEKRGTRPPEEIHRLARKTREAVDVEAGQKASCHSDYVADAESARRVQEERLVQIGG